MQSPRDPEVVRAEVEGLVGEIAGRTSDDHDEQLYELLTAAWPSRESQLN